MHQAGVQQHRRVRSLGGSNRTTQTEKDEDLALFHEMLEKEMAEVSSSAAQNDRSPLMDSRNKAFTEDIFSSTEWDRNDYGWLLTAPSTPSIPDREQEMEKNRCSVSGTASAKSLLKTARPGISRSEPPFRAEPVSRIAAHSLAGLCRSINSGPRKPLLSSTDDILRPSTPTSNGRPSTTKSQSAARPATPTRATSARPSSPSGSSTRSVRPATPTGRSAMISSARDASSSRPSIARSAGTSVPTHSLRAPTASVSMASPRPGGTSSRASTPVKRPATPTRTSNPPSTISQSSTVNKRSASPQPKSAATSRPSSPSARARQPAAHPAALPGFSQEPPPNLRTTAPERPLSNPRGSVVSRANGARSIQPAETNEAARRLRLSGSPIVNRGRLSSDSINSEKSHARTKPHDAPQIPLSNAIRSEMMDRTVPAKKPLAVPEKISALASHQVKKSVNSSPMRETMSTIPSVRETGFGRNLSKKSLDMALRHMDIRTTAPTGFKAFMSNVSPSSLYSVRSSNGRGRSNSLIADSPMATSSNASSEYSMNFAIDRELSDIGDEMLSERGSKASSISQPGSYDEKKVSSWLGSPSPNYAAESNADILQVFEQGITTSESPLVSHRESRMECDNFALEPMQ